MAARVQLKPEGPAGRVVPEPLERVSRVSPSSQLRGRRPWVLLEPVEGGNGLSSLKSVITRDALQLIVSFGAHFSYCKPCKSKHSGALILCKE